VAGPDVSGAAAGAAAGDEELPGAVAAGSADAGSAEAPAAGDDADGTGVADVE
jgi:hypothetical protein